METNKLNWIEIELNWIELSWIELNWIELNWIERETIRSCWELIIAYDN